VWLDINTPPTRNNMLAISPDGLKVVFVATSQLWIRALDSPSAQKNILLALLDVPLVYKHGLIHCIVQGTRVHCRRERLSVNRLKSSDLSGQRRISASKDC
jgi:hypothetical protein